MLWAFAGTAAQILFDSRGVTAVWLVAVRLLMTGAVLTFWLGTTGRLRLADLRRHWRALVIFGVVGVGLVQFTYYATIALSNVAMATFLQYLGPATVTLYESLQERRWPRPGVVLALVGSTVGTALLVLGRSGHISVSTAALVVGLLSAVCFAFNTLYPVKLVRSIGGWQVTAGSFMVGGIGFAFVAPLWRLPVHPLGALGVTALVVVIVLGTIVPFGIFYSSLTRVSPTEASIAATSEPIAAAVFGWLIMRDRLTGPQLLGGALILAALILISMARERSGTPVPDQA